MNILEQWISKFNKIVTKRERNYSNDFYDYKNTKFFKEIIKKIINIRIFYCLEF